MNFHPCLYESCLIDSILHNNSASGWRIQVSDPGPWSHSCSFVFIVYFQDCYPVVLKTLLLILEKLNRVLQMEVRMFLGWVYPVYRLPLVDSSVCTLVNTITSVVPRLRFLRDTCVPLPEFQGDIYKFWRTHQIFQIFTC